MFRASPDPAGQVHVPEIICHEKKSQCNIRQRRKLYTWALGWPSWHGWHREHCPQTGSPRKLQQLPVNLLTIHNFSSLAALRIYFGTWRHMMAVDWNLRSLVEQSDWAISRMTREKGIWRSKIVVHISSHMIFCNPYRCEFYPTAGTFGIRRSVFLW